MSYLYLIVLLYLPGFLIARMLSGKVKLCDSFFRSSSLAFPFSLFLYLPTAFIGSFVQMSTECFDILHSIIIASCVILYLIFQLKVDFRIIRSSLAVAQHNLIKTKAVFVSILNVALIISFYNLVEIHSDSVAHHLMFNYYSTSSILTNEMQLKNVAPFDVANLDGVLPKNTQLTISEPTYDFKFYQIIIGQSLRLSKSSSIDYFKSLWNFLLPISILAILFLGQSLGFRIRQNILLLNIFLLFAFVLKNFFGQTQIGSLPYSILSNYHPTNIVTLIILPICLGLFARSVEKNEKINFLLFYLIFFIAFLIHKISLLCIIPMTFFFLISYQVLIFKKINIYKILTVFMPTLILLILYLFYNYNLKLIYPNLINNINYMNSSMVDKIQFNSVIDFFRNYFIFLENTYYKYLYFPGVLFTFLITILILKTTKRITLKYVYIFMTFMLLTFFLIPGMHYLVFKIFKSFIQRFFILYNLEILSTMAVFFLFRKLNSLRLFKWIHLSIFILILSTTIFDLHRKGNQYAIFNQNRLEVFNFLNDNTLNSNYLADIDTEIIMNSLGSFESKTFGLTQDEVIRRRKSGFQFHEQLNYLLYNEPENHEFIRFSKMNNIKYIILEKVNYFQSYKDQLSSKTFNSNFDNLYSKLGQQYKKIFENNYHIVYQII